MTIKRSPRKEAVPYRNHLRYLYSSPSHQPEHADQLLYDKRASNHINSDDYIDEIREVMASKRHRDFPILDKMAVIWE